MKPAVNSKRKAIIMGILVGAFAFYWYFDPFHWLGAIMGLFAGFFTFFILNTSAMERFRRVFFIGLFLLVFISILLIILDSGIGNFISWVDIHEKAYYLPGQGVPGQSTGALSYPCTREVPQILLGRANYLTGLGMWETTFPSTITQFLVLMIPFFITGLIFGRGFCGWI